MPSRRTVVFVSLLVAFPAVIYFLWFFIQPKIVALLCPEGCRCNIEQKEILDIFKCNGTSFTYLTTINYFTNLKKLRFTEYKISLLQKDTFVSLSELEELYLWRSGLSKIELEAFNGLKKLTFLSIWDNEICEILPGTFDNMISLEHLALSRNRIERLDRDMFSGLFKLKEIDLSENKLQYLHPDTFLRLPNLQTLILANNTGLKVPTDRNLIKSHSLSRLDISICNIGSVSVESFANVSALEGLDLSFNNLTTVDKNILKALPKLSELYLDSNEICEIKPGTFENMISLEVLNLDDNRIEHVDRYMFRGLFKLTSINLSGNKLQYLHPNTFLRLPNLQTLTLANNPGLKVATDRNLIKSLSLLTLDISGCNVSSVSVETFANVSALEWLDLSFNKLKTVDINVLRALPKLSTLYLDDNPLHCDCQLKKVWQWCKDRNIQTVYEETEPKCNTPSEMEGMGWEVLKKVQCL